MTEVTAFAGGALAFWALSPRLATIVAMCHILFNVALYAWLTPPRVTGFATFMGPVNPVLGFACFIAAVGFALMLWRMASGVPEPQTKAQVSSVARTPLEI